MINVCRACPFGLRRFPVWRGCSNVEEVVAFVDDALKATAAQGLGLDLRSKSLTLGNAQMSLALLSLNRDFLAHAVVVVTLALVLRLDIDIDAERFMAHDLHRRFITIAWIVVQIVRKLFSAFDFPCAEGHGLTNVTHIHYYLLVIIPGEASLHGCEISSLSFNDHGYCP